MLHCSFAATQITCLSANFITFPAGCCHLIAPFKGMIIQTAACGFCINTPKSKFIFKMYCFQMNLSVKSASFALWGKCSQIKLKWPHRSSFSLYHSVCASFTCLDWSDLESECSNILIKIWRQGFPLAISQVCSQQEEHGLCPFNSSPGVFRSSRIGLM